MTLGAIPGRDHHGPRGGTLAELAEELDGAVVRGDPNTRVNDVHHDSREVGPGDLFVARKGQHADGRGFVRDAVARGAAAVLSATEVDAPVPVLVAPDLDYALAWCSSHVWAHPTWTLDVLGVTGTNGKTTTTWLVEHALLRAGNKCGLLGTVAQRYGGLEFPALHTTPEADDLARRFSAMLHAGASSVVMEVSSHALSLQRVGAVRFRAAALTNVTQDHLDFHGSFEKYVAAKCSLFEAHRPAVSVINLDDEVGVALAGRLHGVVGYSAKGREGAVLRVVDGGATPDGIEATIATPAGAVRLRSPLRGDYNVENLLAALGLLNAMEIPYARGAELLSDALGAPGRLERVAPTQGTVGFDVLVDYAHSPDALAQVLRAIRGTTRGRVVCVFGCGGDRDPTKRPVMGAAVARGADVAVLTTDNPRNEDPEAIAEGAAKGLRDGGMKSSADGDPGQGQYAVTLDRRAAIARAVGLARPGDVVLIAGKGHETYQEVRGRRSTFDDRVEARAALDARLAAGGKRLDGDPAAP